jgi:prepilin-type N-terminal cleavage/methylation domain-containing protein
MERSRHRGRTPESGFSLIEMLVALTVTGLVMGATLAGVANARKTADTVMQVTSVNGSLRTGMDLMFTDLLQAGAGLPKGHVVQIPSAGALVRRPGPPGTAYTAAAADLTIPAVIPGARLGPSINGAPTDMITILTVDNTFNDVPVTAMTSTSVDVNPGLNIGTGMDRVAPGQLVMVSKGSATTLVQVTSISAGAGRINFATGDSLNLNQTGGAVVGNLARLIALAPGGAAGVAATRVSRVRMITYYLDNTTVPGRPRLVRRINNGDPLTFNNNLGTAVATDVENLRLTYDLNNGANDPTNVRFLPADFTTAGACAPAACSPVEIRKVTVTLGARSGVRGDASVAVFRNALTSQVSLRGMALVNDYQ